MLCLLHHLYIHVITCAYSHIVYTKNQQKLLIFLPIDGHFDQIVRYGLLLHFSMNLSETFRINVNMDFAHTNRGRFLI